MEYIKKFLIPIFLILITIFCLVKFRTLPAAKLWKSYTVLYVQADFPAEQVEYILEQYKAVPFISLENQKVPLMVKHETPEVSLALTKIEKSNYLESRKAYFFDRSKSYKIYYIPEELHKQTEEAVLFMQQKGLRAGINISSSFPYISVGITIIFSMLLIILSKKKILQALLSVLPDALVCSVPFYTVSSAVCLILTGIFVFQKIEGRNGIKKALLRQVMIPCFIGAGVILLILTGLKTAMLLLPLLLSELSILYLYNQGYKAFQNIFSFKPVPIVPAYLVNQTGLLAKKAVVLCAAGTVVLLFAAVASAKGASFSVKSHDVQLPSPKGTYGSLPGLEDFILWKWEALTFPYKSLNATAKKTEDGETVYLHRFSSENGVLSERTESMTYNSAFREAALSQIDSLEYPAIEKMLKEQGSLSANGFMAAGNQSLSVRSLILMLFGIGVPLGMYAMYFRKQKENV